MKHIINFQKQFVEYIECGTKKSTARKPTQKRLTIKAGDTLRLYSGLRTKQCRLIKECVCTAATKVIIHRGLGAILGEYEYTYWSGLEIESLAKKEGFENASKMREWFETQHKISQTPFEGILIEWD